MKSPIIMKTTIAITLIVISVFSIFYIKKNASTPDSRQLIMNIINNSNSCIYFDVVDFNYPNAKNIRVSANAEYIRVYVDIGDINPENNIQTGEYFLTPNENNTWSVKRFIRNQELKYGRYEVYDPYPIIDYDIVRNLEMINLLNLLVNNGYLETSFGDTDELSDDGLEYINNKYNTSNVYFKASWSSSHLYSATLKINYGESDEKELSLTNGSIRCTMWPEPY